MGADRYLPIEPIEFAPGRRDVLVELVSGGFVSARVVTNARLFDHSLQLVLRPTSGPLTAARKLELAGRATRSTASDTLTVYDWKSVRPGTYELTVRARGQ